MFSRVEKKKISSHNFVYNHRDYERERASKPARSHTHEAKSILNHQAQNKIWNWIVKLVEIESIMSNNEISLFQCDSCINGDYCCCCWIGEKERMNERKRKRHLIKKWNEIKTHRHTAQHSKAQKMIEKARVYLAASFYSAYNAHAFVCGFDESWR